MTSAITRLRLLGDSADELTKWQADVELRELEAKRKRERKEREACEQQQQQAANISQAWWDAIDQRIQQHWRHNLSVAHGADTSKPLDAYGALKTMIDNWQPCFRDTLKARTRADVSKALDGRNSVSHASGEIPAADAISYLTAIRGVAEAIPAKAVVEAVKPLIDDQIKAAAKAMGVAPDIASLTNCPFIRT